MNFSLEGIIPYRPHGCFEAGVATQYRLHHPIVGFIQSTKQTVTIPAGAIVIARIHDTDSPGICIADWNGQMVQVFRMDLERHGSVGVLRSSVA